ncbi:transcription factor bHLH121 isoform X2 [Syzygium oleosum]|uniref:transcription factor bHLH121 isoform X2 n=1 Tax=Syzygium oleosum TaxID=219896 RepID=UPI0011D2AAE8|nr:transcription factor bHLH121 isoform X2 [Syzygium oleosum]
MDQWRTDLGASTSVQHPSSRLRSSHDESTRQREEAEVKDPVVARKVQKADREKLRRDRLNEHFLDLGSTLDPDKPKNDKATILTDTIQVLKDLTTEVNRLKAECAALTEESRELMQEKNELREEKSSLKSEVENLNVQYQQRMRVMYPWAAMDPSVIMGPAYSYPVPIPVPPGPIPMHPQLQPFPFFGNQNASAIPAPCSTFIPYSMPANPTIEQQSTQYASSSHVSNKQDSKSTSSDHRRGSNAEQHEDSNDVATDLELKMPGTSSQQDLTTGEKKGKQMQRKEISIADGSSSSKFSSSQAFPDSSSNSVSDNPKSSR